MINPTDTRKAIALLREAIKRGDAQLVTLDGKPAGAEAVMNASLRQQHVVAHPFTGVNAIERANREAGMHWFEPESMRFFGTEILRYFGAGVFTTRETDPMGKTAWSIRVASPDGNVTTFGLFHSFGHAKTAGAAAKRLAALLVEGRTVFDERGQTFTLDA